MKSIRIAVLPVEIHVALVFTSFLKVFAERINFGADLIYATVGE